MGGGSGAQRGSNSSHATYSSCFGASYQASLGLSLLVIEREILTLTPQTSGWYRPYEKTIKFQITSPRLQNKAVTLAF